MNRLYSALKSVRLALVIVAFVVVTSIIATLIPQNEQPAFYYHHYPTALRWLILNLDLDHFFRSFIFIVPLILFTINLGACTVDRFIREHRRGRRRRYGPDLVHLGLLILIVGGIVTFADRREALMYMGTGDSVELPGGYVIKLLSFDTLTYKDGRPKAWISTVDAYKNHTLVAASFPIKVNKPLALGNIDVYQTTYSEQGRVLFRDAKGAEETVAQDQMIQIGSATLMLTDVSPLPSNGSKFVATFNRYEHYKLTGILELTEGQKVGPYTAERIGTREVTGLRAVIDPGFLPAVIGLIVCALGLALTFAQKLGEKEL